MQPELGRRVALRRLEPGTPFDASRWPERTGVVRLYAVTETAAGVFLATQWVPGARTLAETHRVRAGRRRRWVDAAEAILAGAEHGRLTEEDILVGGDGDVWITGFGNSVVEKDAEALARIRTAQRGRPRVVIAAAAGATGAAAVVAALTLGSEGAKPAPAPPLTAGATAIGSALEPGAVRTVDCEGSPPSGSSNPCTVLQLQLDGRPLEAPFKGIARTWAVRGATGRVALQILVPVDGGYSRYNGTRFVTVDDPDATRVFRSDRLVPKGARFGLELAPGGGVGVRSAGDGASTGRVFGRLRYASEVPDLRGGEGQELQLRVDLVRRFRAR